MECPSCRATVAPGAICESLWQQARTGAAAVYLCCGRAMQPDSVYQAVSVLTYNEHVGLQVRDLEPPYETQCFTVFGAYGIVTRARLPVQFMPVAEARGLFGTELHGKTGSGTRLPIVTGTFHGKHLLIDGIHRINDAANSGEPRIPFFRLSAEQTHCILRRREE